MTAIIEPPKKPVNIMAVIDGCKRLKFRIECLERQNQALLDDVHYLRNELDRHYREDHPCVLDVPLPTGPEAKNAKANGNGANSVANTTTTGDGESNKHQS